MEIQLLQNKSDNNVVSKSVSSIMTVTGTLRSESSIVSPSIMINADDSIVECNYCYIPEFNRYYYVNDIVSVRNGIWRIECHCDVLMTYADEIKENIGITRRQEGKWNLYLDDGVFKVYQNPILLTKPFPQGFNTFQFVLAVAGG